MVMTCIANLCLQCLFPMDANVEMQMQFLAGSTVYYRDLYGKVDDREQVNVEHIKRGCKGYNHMNQSIGTLGLTKRY